MMDTFTNSIIPENLCWVSTLGLPKEWQWREPWFDRQERIDGFDQQKIQDAFVWIFGCNGLGRTTAEFVVRKGYGKIGLVDPDVVEISNLHRTLWHWKAVGEFKSIRAVAELTEIAPGRTEVLGYVGTLEEVFIEGLVTNSTACIVGIDNDAGRAHAATELHKQGIPGIFFALSKDTYTYEVFVQEPGGACWACLHPDRYLKGLDHFQVTACPKVASIADPCLVAVGLCTYALDSLVMGRPRSWNFRQGHLHGELPEQIDRISPRADCPLCAIKTFAIA